MRTLVHTQKCVTCRIATLNSRARSLAMKRVRRHDESPFDVRSLCIYGGHERPVSIADTVSTEVSTEPDTERRRSPRAPCSCIFNGPLIFKLNTGDILERKCHSNISFSYSRLPLMCRAGSPMYSKRVNILATA